MVSPFRFRHAASEIHHNQCTATGTPYGTSPILILEAQKSLQDSDSHHLSGDGIHLNKDCMARYVRSLRGAVYLALQKFHNE